ncbi:type II toxin-antitoxin system RatA family toxin [Geodermatophilus sp. SYSU D00742]
MRSVTLTAHVPVPADAAYRRLRDFAAYPAHCPAVRTVTVTDVDGDAAVSRWEADFRNGVLRWTEQDTFDDPGRRISFVQLEGDVDVFRGSWRCRPGDGGCRITFTAEVDLGIPTLADVLEPIAVRALAENTTSILTGLFGPAVRVLACHDAVPAAAPGLAATAEGAR